MEMATYRVILVFTAADSKEAKAKAESAAKAATAKVDRLTERKETWAAIAED
jgi:hypothetical protein